MPYREPAIRLFWMVRAAAELALIPPVMPLNTAPLIQLRSTVPAVAPLRKMASADDGSTIVFLTTTFVVVPGT